MDEQEVRRLINQNKELEEQVKNSGKMIAELEDQVRTTVGLLMQNQQTGGAVAAKIAEVIGEAPGTEKKPDSSFAGDSAPFSSGDYWKLADRIGGVERRLQFAEEIQQNQLVAADKERVRVGNIEARLYQLIDELCRASKKLRKNIEGPPASGTFSR